MNDNRTYDLFEFPTNLGLLAATIARQPGVVQLPKWLKQHGLYDGFAFEHIYRLPSFPYQMEIDEETGVLNSRLVAQYALAQSQMLINHWNDNSFKLIIGGDCSILLGTALALKQKGHYGLFFLDGHTDYIPLELSKSKAVAGMDLAIVTGLGHDSLTDILGFKPYFHENNVYCVGNRNKASSYVAPILESSIHYYDLEEIRRIGTDAVAANFLDMVQDHRLDGFFIHVDVDVLDDAIMPAVDSRRIGGLTYKELVNVLHPLVNHPKAVGIEIAILDPELDVKGLYTKEFVKQFNGSFD